MKLRARNKFWIFFFILLFVFTALSLPEFFHRNHEVSISQGNVRNGILINGWLIPFRGKNFHYFSPLSYFILNNAYVHSSVYATLIDAYTTCEKTCPGKEFVLMECSRRKGGRMLFHWTHQNGLSVDFMVPVKRGSRSNSWINSTGLFHYLLKFDENGKFSMGQKTEIDFETMALHIIALDDSARKHGLSIRKILFHSALLDDLYSSEAGKILADRQINFIPHLRPLINKFHDEHYHIDFEFL